MRPLTIKTDVVAYLKTNWTRTPVRDPNKDNVDTSASHITPYFRPGMVSSLEIMGASDRVGVFIIQIFTPLNVGTDEGWGHGGRLEELFHNQLLGDIQFQAGDQVPRTEPVGIDKDLQMYQHNTIVPFTVITEA